MSAHHPSSAAWIKNAWWSASARKRRRVARAYREFFRSEDGQLIVQDLQLYCNVSHSSFDPQNSNQTLFNEGQRDVFLHLAGMAQLDDSLMQDLDPVQP